jgi:UDP-N-acetylmuramoyl-tripeptide--D-alanyl-D-alanine ligase
MRQDLLAVAGTLRLRLLTLAAWIWRRCLWRTTVIAVTGSVGKTTTKELLVAVLADHGLVCGTRGNWHGYASGGSAAAVLSARLHHRFLVVEAGIERRGELRRLTSMLKPDIAVVLEVRKCHSKVFRNIQGIAEEKSQIIRRLRKNATAVLNFDNPHTLQMRDLTKARVIGFGRSPEAAICLESADAAWPERLTCQIRTPSSVVQVPTQFVGEHFSTSVLATIAVTEALKISADQAAAAISRVPPFWGRLQPIEIPGLGATLLRDELNGSIDTFTVAIEVLRNARAKRKIVVFSDYSDSPRTNRERAADLGRFAAETADVAVFVGDYANRAKKKAISQGLPEDMVRSFHNLEEATRFLEGIAQKDDLILLKGRANHHLSRIYLGLFGNVACKLASCPRQHLCDRCPQLGFNWHPELTGLVAPPDSYA